MGTAIVAAILDETLPPEVTLFELATGMPLLRGATGEVEGGDDGIFLATLSST